MNKTPAIFTFVALLTLGLLLPVGSAQAEDTESAAFRCKVVEVTEDGVKVTVLSKDDTNGQERVLVVDEDAKLKVDAEKNVNSADALAAGMIARITVYRVQGDVYHITRGTFMSEAFRQERASKAKEKKAKGESSGE